MEITVLKRTDFPIAGLEGERFTISYRESNNHNKTESTVQDEVIAFRNIKGYGEIIYTIGLITPTSRHQKDKNIFDKILKLWTTDNLSKLQDK
jgi:hypothetical protein